MRSIRRRCPGTEPGRQTGPCPPTRRARSPGGVLKEAQGSRGPSSARLRSGDQGSGRQQGGMRFAARRREVEGGGRGGVISIRSSTSPPGTRGRPRPGARQRNVGPGAVHRRLPRTPGRTSRARPIGGRPARPSRRKAATGLEEHRSGGSGCRWRRPDELRLAPWVSRLAWLCDRPAAWPADAHRSARSADRQPAPAPQARPASGEVEGGGPSRRQPIARVQQHRSAAASRRPRRTGRA